MTFTIILILFWYIFTGIREALTWSKKDEFLKISKDTYSFLLVPLSFALLMFAMPYAWGLWFVSVMFILFALSLIGREYLDQNRDEQFLFWKIDYHTLRGIEGFFYFVTALVIMKDFFLLSAVWIVGNWIYKRVMNKVMYGTFKHKLTMSTYWMLGYPLPYSDRWYDYSLILPLLYFIGRFL